MTPVPAGAPRGRFAPSPTGEMHLGNASSALLVWLSMRARNGRIVLRIEDLDRARVRPELTGAILSDLEWLGLDWDEGGERGGPHAPYAQSERMSLYHRAFERLREAGRVFPCFCSRKDVRAAASAPQLPGETARYPGTCRRLDPGAARERMARGERHAWRYRVGPDDRPSFTDLVRGAWDGSRQPPPGDFVVQRSDGVPAYQLAVVVDDAEMEITEVVRGDDLLSSTPQQLLLYASLDLRPPQFGHVPLLLDPEGIRLSKRQRGITLRELREAGFTPPQVVGRLAGLLGLRPGARPVAARDLVEGFSLARLPPAPSGLVVDVDRW